MGGRNDHHVDDVRAVVAAHLPGHRAGTVVRSGAGQDNVAYEVDGELIVRFGLQDDPAERAARVEHESRLLAAVAEMSPLPVPEPMFTDPGRGCLAYAKLPGLPLLRLPGPAREAYGPSVAAALGGLLTALHTVPAERLAGLVERDDFPPEEWLREAAETYETVSRRVPAAHRPAVEEFLAAPPPAGGWEPVFSHNDLGVEHVLVDPATGRVTGVIDWGDAAITDPAYDFGLLYRDLGPSALDAAVGGYRGGAEPASLRERAVFYARCGALEDLAYGLEPGQEAYADKSVVAMTWLFPVQP
ncbi:phosphotransferase family protein [Streptosporangium sp. NPDC004379]|uniref:phosphotransferase family protein n=1 Tax=Streptosporangium sp. NPDC004379 TaxID=3366189 RepID=UPI00368A71AA